MLLLVRHGESTGNADGLLLGHLDRPLTEWGRTQARSLHTLVSGATRVVSSPLERARHTAELLGTGLPVEIDERWIEMDYGAFDGTPVADVPSEVWAQWRADPTYRPPGGESLADTGQRVRSACQELLGSGGDARGDGIVVVVSHVSPIKAAVCWALGLGDEGAWRLHLATASLTRITGGPGGPVLQAFNVQADPPSSP